MFHPSTAAAAGLLLSAVWAGDIDRQLLNAVQRAPAANAGSVTLSADVRD